MLDAIGQKTNTPILLDYAKIAARGLDINSVSVTVERHRYAWFTLLTRITSPSFLSIRDLLRRSPQTVRLGDAAEERRLCPPPPAGQTGRQRRPP